MSNTIEFYTGDARSLNIKDLSIDLVVTQVPFYQTDFFNYGGDQSKQIGSEKNIKKYVNSLVLATKEMERVLKSTGSIVVVIPNEFEVASNYILKVLKKTNLLLANPPFVWNFLDKEAPTQFGSVSFKYDLIFHFIKSPKLIYSNPYKVNSYQDGVWNISWNSEDELLKKINTIGFAENSFRTEIPKRFIEMFSRPGQTVLDPFGGSGTTACEAYKLGRNAISVDVSEDQTDLAKIRLDIIEGKTK
jgi:site-specific DNA-methyltransferase (adenine-specific)